MVRERLLKYVSATDDVVLQRLMLRGLWNVGTKNDVRVIIRYVDSPDEVVRQNAEVGLRKLTKVKLGDDAHSDSNSVIVLRKAWWEQHKNDQEYR